MVEDEREKGGSSLFAQCGARWVDWVFCGLQKDVAVVFPPAGRGEHGKKNALTGRGKEEGEKIRYGGSGEEVGGFVATCVAVRCHKWGPHASPLCTNLT